MLWRSIGPPSLARHRPAARISAAFSALSLDQLLCCHPLALPPSHAESKKASGGGRSVAAKNSILSASSPVMGLAGEVHHPFH